MGALRDAQEKKGEELTAVHAQLREKQKGLSMLQAKLDVVEGLRGKNVQMARQLVTERDALEPNNPNNLNNLNNPNNHKEL